MYTLNVEELNSPCAAIWKSHGTLRSAQIQRVMSEAEEKLEHRLPSRGGLSLITMTPNLPGGFYTQVFQDPPASHEDSTLSLPLCRAVRISRGYLSDTSRYLLASIPPEGGEGRAGL